MSDNHSTTYEELDWLQSVEDDDESDFGSRSTSTLSWTDDAEKEISEEMKNQYDLFESALYSELDGEDLPEPIIKEVEMWKQYSPHLRVTGTHILPTFQPEEIVEKYPSDYEEIYAVHCDKDDIASQLKSKCSIAVGGCENPNKLNEEVAKLIETVWSDVVKEAKPDYQKKEINLSSFSSLQSPKKENSKIFCSNKALDRRPPLSSRSCLIRHEEKCNHIKIEEDQIVSPSPSWRLNKISQTMIHPRPIHNVCSIPGRVSGATSAHLPKRKSLFNELIPEISQVTESSNSGSSRFGILPPIQAIPIIPKLPNKRSNSAMLRFTKTLPRTRPNTSKNKAIVVTSIDVSQNFAAKEAEEIVRGHLSPLVPKVLHNSGKKKSVHSKVPLRWRY